MKVELNEIRLGVSALTGKVQAGILAKEKDTWKENTDVHRDFIACVIDLYEGKSTILRNKTTGQQYELILTKISPDVTESERTTQAAKEEGTGIQGTGADTNGEYGDH